MLPPSRTRTLAALALDEPGGRPDAPILPSAPAPHLLARLARTVAAAALASSAIVGCGSSSSGGGTAESGFNRIGSDEPFSGTVFPEPGLLGEDSPDDFAAIADGGRGARRVFDGRLSAFVDVDAFLFTATYANGDAIEVVVNPELGGAASARTAAERDARRVGQLPAALRQDLRALWIHGGDALWSSVSDDGALVLHTGRAAEYASSGILEETLLHEAVHVSLDAAHARAPGWLAAQRADGGFVSTYAKDNPGTEDLAETFLVWFAVRHLRERIDPTTARLVEESVPARLDYLDAQGFDLSPAVP